MGAAGFVAEDTANWLGCFMTISGCVGSICNLLFCLSCRAPDCMAGVGVVMDKFNGHLKAAVSALMLLSCVGFGVFCLCIAGALPLSHHPTVVLAYAAGIWGGFFFNCSIPLFSEITMETIFGAA